jgi:hypothetical protein
LQPVGEKLIAARDIGTVRRDRHGIWVVGG